MGLQEPDRWKAKNKLENKNKEWSLWKHRIRQPNSSQHRLKAVESLKAPQNFMQLQVFLDLQPFIKLLFEAAMALKRLTDEQSTHYSTRDLGFIKYWLNFKILSLLLMVPESSAPKIACNLTQETTLTNLGISYENSLFFPHFFHMRSWNISGGGGCRNLTRSADLVNLE